MTTQTIEVAGLHGGHVSLTGQQLDDVDSRIAGPLLRAGDKGWDEAVLVWKASVAKQPALVVHGSRPNTTRTTCSDATGTSPGRTAGWPGRSATMTATPAVAPTGGPGGLAAERVRTSVVISGTAPPSNLRMSIFEGRKCGPADKTAGSWPFPG